MRYDLDPSFRLPGPWFSPDPPKGEGGSDEKRTTAGVTPTQAGSAYDNAERPFSMEIKDGKITVTEKVTPAGESA